MFRDSKQLFQIQPLAWLLADFLKPEHEYPSPIGLSYLFTTGDDERKRMRRKRVIAHDFPGAGGMAISPTRVMPDRDDPLVAGFVELCWWSRVKGYTPQSCVFTYRDARGVDRTHVPDALLHFWNGGSVARPLLVTLQRATAHEATEAEMREVTKIAALHRIDHIVLTEFEVFGPYLHNRRMLS